MADNAIVKDTPPELVQTPPDVLAQPHWLTTVFTWGLVVLFASLPFELYAGITIAGFTLTNVEILALAVLAVWGASLTHTRRLPRIPRWFVLLSAALLVTMIVSTALAPAWRGAALKFTARQVQGALLALCLADQIAVRGQAIVRSSAAAIVLGAGLSAMLGLLELSESALVLGWLAVFKDQPTTAVGLLRLSATFTYANIAAMYYEAVLPVVLCLTGLAASRHLRLLLAVGAFILYLATLLTYSRAALITASAAVLIVGLAAVLLRRHMQRALPVAGLCMLLLATVTCLLLFSPMFRVRMAEPDVDRWYRATYTVAPVGPLRPNELAQTPVTVRNDGLVGWRPDGVRPVFLSYHWLDAATRAIVRYNGRRTALPQQIAPGQSVTLPASVQAPDRPGDYVLAWDVVQENSAWFSELGNPLAEVPVRVAGSPIPNNAPQLAEPAEAPREITVRPAPPPRRALWGAAFALWREHPLLGIGPDVFRHVYGPLIGLKTWDDRIHTNNLYLELLVGSGLIGLLAFLALVTGTLAAAGRLLLAASTSPLRLWMLLGCTASLATYLIHGLLDMFLEYSATYLLFWASLGALAALVAPARQRN